VLRDLMDHYSIDTTLGYYSVGEAKKRAAMELLARHTVDNRGTVRPMDGEHSRVAGLREQLSRQLGAQSDAASGRSTSPLLEQLEERTVSLETDNARLRDQVRELESALGESNETLEAAREVNRELMAEINRSERLDQAPAATTRNAALSERRGRTRQTERPV
jgi:hypothetical protein